METRKIAYSEITQMLGSNIVEFTSIFDEDEGVYPILGDFGNFLISNLNNDAIKMKCFRFINDAINFGDSNTIEAIKIEIFEQFYENDELVAIGMSCLDEKAKVLFEEYLQRYRNPSI